MKLQTISSLAIIFCCFAKATAQFHSPAVHPVDVTAVQPQQDSKKPNHTKPVLVTTLPDEVKETSGLVFFSGRLWTINDGGNQPAIYQVDTTNGDIMRKILIGNALNTDWESITQDDSSIYIGDVGNNYGNRKNLQILKIAKADILNPANDTVKAGFISFTYDDQVDFSPRLNQTNFDCEAFFYYNDSLHLFSKNWSDQQTRHYVLPSLTGIYKANVRETFNADGLITDAAINSSGTVVLLGYKNTGGRSWKCFCWLFKGCSDNHFFGRDHMLIGLGSAFGLGQTEGIFLRDDNTAWISSESIQAGIIAHQAKLLRLDFGQFLK